jgi:16S rRNA (cytosine1402-N4)-methyltransferase
VRNAKTLANAIVEARTQKPFETIADLLNVCEANRIGEKHKYLAQVFQAVRIDVNDELSALKDLLQQSFEVLKSGGRLAVITFHSLEDRLVKNFMKHGTFEDEPVKDVFGNIERKFKVITKKPIEASEKEQKENSRSRSAKLRVAEKI